MATCYYCGEPIVANDVVVPLPLKKAVAQDHGGWIYEDQEVATVHQSCLGAPDG